MTKTILTEQEKKILKQLPEYREIQVRDLSMKILGLTENEEQEDSKQDVTKEHNELLLRLEKLEKAGLITGSQRNGLTQITPKGTNIVREMALPFWKKPKIVTMIAAILTALFTGMEALIAILK